MSLSEEYQRQAAEKLIGLEAKGWKPSWAERIERKRTNAFAKGYARGAEDEMERIIDQLLRDSLVITQIEVRVLERIIEIVENGKA
jgi:hypothetical protein